MNGCKPCRDERRPQIDRAIINGVALRTIAATYSLSLGSVHRHKQHVRDLVNKALAAREGKDVKQGTPLLDRLEEVTKCAKELVAHARRDKQWASANQALQTIVRCAELMARASGELATPGNVGGIHFHQSKTLNINVGTNNDTEIAMLVGEATANFDLTEFMRLKRLAQAQEKPALCMNSTPAENESSLNTGQNDSPPKP